MQALSVASHNDNDYNVCGTHCKLPGLPEMPGNAVMPEAAIETGAFSWIPVVQHIKNKDFFQLSWLGASNNLETQGCLVGSDLLHGYWRITCFSNGEPMLGLASSFIRY